MRKFFLLVLVTFVFCVLAGFTRQVEGTQRIFTMEEAAYATKNEAEMGPVIPFDLQASRLKDASVVLEDELKHQFRLALFQLVAAYSPATYQEFQLSFQQLPPPIKKEYALIYQRQAAICAIKKQTQQQKKQSVKEPVPEKQRTPKATVASNHNQGPKIPANQLFFLNERIDLEDCQGSAEAPYDGKAGYWQGTGLVADGQSTHIIGHNPGIFKNLLQLKMGDAISLIDRNGQERTYYVYQLMDVNDNGFDSAGQDQWAKILSQTGESISLQTCIDDFWNRMVLAK